jgi:hypothetical protein
MTPTRRDMLKISLGGAGTLILPGGGLLPAAAQSPDEPHFFLMIVLNGGADCSYMFDARPLSMTKAGKIQNYLKQEPAPFSGRNGTGTLATSLVKPLLPFRDRFSILNGVYMTPSFDGHLQNMNFLFTGNAFGGDSFIPHLNLPDTGREPQSLDGVLSSDPVVVTVNNHSAVVPLMPRAVAGLANSLKQTPPLAGGELTEFIRGRMTANAFGPGRLSAAAALMQAGLDKSPRVHRQLAQLTPASNRDSPEQQTLALITQCFRRSMLDVTTVMVASEFGRTMRSPDGTVDDTGTNHNQFSNSILIGGKGIRGGLVIGASDLRDEVEEPSAAHLQLDPMQEKTMGLPFDFATLTSRPDLPAAFDIKDYLTIGSVVNTIYTLFGVPKEHYRVLRRELPTAPVLHGLLA